MIVTPPLKPELLTQVETDFGSTICKHIFRKIMFYQLWVNRSLPVGMILSFYGSQEFAGGGLIDKPNGKFWQWCDGGVINNPNSPLNGQNTPDFKEKFLKGGLTIGALGGQSTINLSHNHGGVTSVENQTGGGGADAGGDAAQGTFHAHSIASNLSSAESVIPPYFETQYYLRVDGGGTEQGAFTSTTGDFIDEIQAKFGKIVSFEFAETLLNNFSVLDALIPIGAIVPIMVNIPNVPQADGNIWQECDGSEITNENSPLRSIGGVTNFVPDMRDRYVKVPAAFGLAGGQGGVNQYDFTHNHSGYTEFHEAPAGMDRSDNANQARQFHRHTVQTDLSVINTEPPFFTVKFYMRIQ